MADPGHARTGTCLHRRPQIAATAPELHRASTKTTDDQAQRNQSNIMNLNTITQLKRPVSADEITQWRDGYAWLAGGTWLFSEPQFATDTLIDLDQLEWLSLEPSRRWARYRCDVPHCGAVPVRRASRMARDAAAARVLQRAAGLVQDLERRHRRRKHLHVVAGRSDDLADGRARGDLHVVATRRGAARSAGARLRHRKQHANILQPGELLRSIHLPATALSKRYALRQSIAHPSGPLGRAGDRHAEQRVLEGTPDHDHRGDATTDPASLRVHTVRDGAASRARCAYPRRWIFRRCPRLGGLQATTSPITFPSKSAPNWRNRE